jgi:hypothetical protein
VTSNRGDVRDFLVTRRAKITPQQAGLTIYGGNRRVPGLHRSGRKHFRHPAVGLLDLMFEAMALEADEGLTLTAYAAEPGTPSYDGLRLLASWGATHQREDNAAWPA